MKLLTEYNGWSIHQSEIDGHFEAWRTKGAKVVKEGKRTEKQGGGINRIVLMATNLNDAIDEVKLRSSRRQQPKELDPYEDPNQTRIV